MPDGIVLKRLLEKEIDDTIDPTSALDLFNGGLRDLALVARRKTKTSIPFLKTERNKPLPTNIVEITSLTLTLASGAILQQAELPRHYGLEIYGNPGALEILWLRDLPEDGVFEIRGHRLPKAMENLSETPELPDFAHNALVYFAAREFFNGDDELEAAEVRNVLYLTKKSELDSYTSQKPNDSSPVIMDVRPPWMRR